MRSSAAPAAGVKAGRRPPEGLGLDSGENAATLSRARMRRLDQHQQQLMLTVEVCRVHFARNLLALVPKSHKDMVAAVFRTIFAQPDPPTVAKTWDTVRHQLARTFPRSAP
jgi:Transposase, Mutator family